jgi:DNA-binding transcriptional regulator LsrR (DeoR family)
MLTRVARMYHEEGLPQREIALRLSLSQSRVSRLLRARGAVGDICFRFFDADGDAVPSPLDARVLGIAAERRRAIGRRVGVAGGAQKYPAVRAALRGGWINVLITDAASAHRLAEETV